MDYELKKTVSAKKTKPLDIMYPKGYISSMRYELTRISHDAILITETSDSLTFMSSFYAQ